MIGERGAHGAVGHTHSEDRATGAATGIATKGTVKTAFILGWEALHHASAGLFYADVSDDAHVYPERVGNDIATVGKDAGQLATGMGCREACTRYVTDQRMICSTEQARIQADSISAATEPTME